MQLQGESMLINPINITQNSQLRKTSFQHKALKIENNIEKTYELSGYQTGRAIFARNSVSFSSQPEIMQLTPYCVLTLVDEPCEPSMQIEINAKEKFPIKQGLFLIYSMALNDQIYEQNQKNGQIIKSYLSCKPYSKNIDFASSQKDFLTSVKTLNDCFFKTEIDNKHIETAKKLAPVALFLSRKTDGYQEELFDIPKHMTEEQYENLIQNISNQDLVEYNNHLLKNSQIKMNLRINKEFYKQNSEMLLDYFNKWSKNNEN